MIIDWAKKLELTPNSILILRGISITPEQTQALASKLHSQNGFPVTIIGVSETADAEAFDENEMRKAGWIRIENGGEADAKA